MQDLLLGEAPDLCGRRGAGREAPPGVEGDRASVLCTLGGPGGACALVFGFACVFVGVCVLVAGGQGRTWKRHFHE